MKLYIPGHGHVDSKVYRIDRALHAYDARLMFARNEDTGDWCVYSRMPHPEPPFPVFGCGKDIPDLDDIMMRVQQGDMMRNGDLIYKDMIRSQEKYRANLKYQGDQAGEESAEVVEHFLRQHGKSPVIKEFIGNDIPKEVVVSDSE